MDKGVSDLLEKAKEYVKAYPDRLKIFMIEYDVEESYYINDETEFWDGILLDLKDPMGVADGFSHSNMVYEIETANDLSDPKRLIIETEKKINFLTNKQKPPKLVKREYSADSSIKLFEDMASARELRFYLRESLITDDLPKGDKNNPLTFFEYIFDNDGLDVLLNEIIPSEKVINDSHLRYEADEFAYYKYNKERDGSDSELKIDLSLKINKVLTDKLLISRKHIEDKISDCEKEKYIRKFLKLMITKLLHLDHVIKKNNINPVYNLSLKIFRDFIDHLFQKYEIYMTDDIKQRIIQNNQTDSKIPLSAQPISVNLSEEKKISQNTGYDAEKPIINKKHYLSLLGGDPFKKTILHLSKTTAEYKANYKDCLNDFVSFYIGKTESDYIKHESEFWNNVISDLERPEELLDGIGFSGLLDDLKYICEKEGYNKILRATNHKLSFLKNLTNNNPIPEYHLKNYMTEDQWDKFLQWLVHGALACNSDGTTNHKYKNNWFLPLISRVLIERGYYNPAIDLPIVKNFAHICNITFKPNLLAKPQRAEQLKRSEKFTYSLPNYTPLEEKK